MAIVTVVLDTSVPQDKEALTQLFGSDFVSAAAKEPEVTVVQHTPAPKKEAPKKVETPPVKEPEPEDLISGGPDLREQAVKKATELVTNGQSAAVREALAVLGAKRVSDLSDDQIEPFLASL